METRANYVIVGIFTLVAILAAFGFVYWSAGLGARGDTATLMVRIPGSAAGLGRGSAVLFNGVKVGDVTRLYIDPTQPTDAIAVTQVDRLTPITLSTKAEIGLAGLTGQANIELRGGSISETNLLAEAETQGETATITAEPSAVTNLLQTAQDVLQRADAAFESLEGFLGDARQPLTATVENAQRFSEALARNADNIDTFLASFGELSQSLGSASERLDSTLRAAEDLLNAVDREKVVAIVGNVEGFTQRLETASSQIDGIMSGVDDAVRSISTLTNGATETLAKVDVIIENVDAADVGTALSNIEQASEDARLAASDISSFTSKIGERSDDIDRIITDAQELSSRLNQASVRVDGVLVKLDNLLGSEEAGGVMAEATETIQAFRQVADTLNARLGTITEGLARFSGQGLREVEDLVRDGRGAINRIERAITDLERNPQRILSGGEGNVRQYDGRVRR
jgi:phospholipid/cholesterol/gamma-HCH transport system substrate-binding protein